MEQSLEELIKRRDELLGVKKKRNKLKKIRNLKIYSKTIKRLTPYIISSILASSAVYACGFGLPVVMDKLDAKKVYEMEYHTPDDMKISEKYLVKLAMDYFEQSELIIYTPYTLCDDGMYIRSKITYKVDIDDSLKLYNSLLEKDYEYIISNTIPISEETEKVNMLNKDFVNDYYVDAKITAIDNNDITKEKETMKANIFITFFDILTGFWLGLIFNRRKRENYFDEISKIYREFNSKIEKVYLENKENYFFYFVEDDYINNEIKSLNYQIASKKGARKI